MDMHMHMFGMMFATTDRLTLMAMVNYVEMDMHLQAAPPAPVHGHGHAAPAPAHGHGHAGSFGHSSDGLGDITLTALYKFYDCRRQRAHFHLGIGLPTAEVEHKQGGVFLPYGMQSGRGIWDIRPGVTWLGQADGWSWGAQATGIFGLEDENDAGFAFGDQIDVNLWIALPISESLSISGRLNYWHQEAIDGHYNGPHLHAAPPHFQANYGGEILFGGVGLNWYGRQGLLKGHRFAAEILWPLSQDLNGVGMERDYTATIGWQKAF